MGIHTTIDIAAPPEAVWRELMDFAEYGTWNPFIKELSGEQVVGSRLRAKIAPPGQAGMVFKPVVLILEPPKRFLWRGSALGVKGDHSFALEALDGGKSCRLVHSEEFQGCLSGLFALLFEKNSTTGFELMNAALKTRAEAAAAAAQ